jgi:apolipoprotein N-acyltransferase
MEAALTVEVPVSQRPALYTLWGDLWAKLFAAAALVMLILGAARGIMKRGRSR